MNAQVIRELGLNFGPAAHKTTVTFGDPGGLITAPNVLRDSSSHTIPTVLGSLAGFTRLLQDPWVVHALKVSLEASGRSLAEHLVSILNANLAAVYGDSATLEKLKRYLWVKHNRLFPAINQPDWFVETTGRAADFRPNEPRLMRSVVLTVASSVAAAHQACRLVPAGSNVSYGQSIMQTIGYVSGLGDDLLLTLSSLEIDAANHGGLPLMTTAQMRAAEVPTLLASVLDTTVDGHRLGDLASLFVGFIPKAERDALELTWIEADQERQATWAAGYAAANAQYNQGAPSTLNEDSFFLVASRTNAEAPQN